MDTERKDLTYRQYAEAEGISYEAVRKKIERNKYSPILKEGRGIKTIGNKKYLTPEAQDFLSEKTRGKNIIKPDPETISQLSLVRSENEDLKTQIVALKSALSVFENLQKSADYQKLEERVTDLSAQIDAKNAEIKALQEAVEKITEEMQKPRKRGIFSRLRGD